MSSGEHQPVDPGIDTSPCVEGHDETTSAPAELADVLPFPSLGLRPASPESEPALRIVIGDVLRDERHRQVRTLAEVADAAAVSLPYLSEVERGRKEISSDLLGAVTGALDLTLVEVLERSVERLRARSQRGLGIQLRAA